MLSLVYEFGVIPHDKIYASLEEGLMKYIYILCLFFIIYPFGCSNQVDSNNDPIEPATFEMKIPMTNAPQDVVKLSGSLTHQVFDGILFNFQIEGDSAKAIVNDIPSGTWLLTVDAYNSDNHVIYTGSTRVSILPGIINQVTLHLNPTTGELLVIVTWGIPDNPPQDPAIIGHYPLDGNLKDISGYDHHGLLFGATPSKDRFGNENSALYFNGDDDYGMIPHYEAFEFDIQKTDYSLSFWVKSSNPERGRLISKWNEHLNTSYPFSFQMNENRCIGLSYDTVGVAIMLEYGNIWDGEWHHLVFILDSKTLTQTGYLDGRLIDLQRFRPTHSTANDNDINIANKPLHDEEKYKGYLDDIYFFNYALSEHDISRLYQGL